MDLLAGFWEVELTDESKPKTAFTTPWGLFQFNVMPFGTTNAPPHFQRMMNVVLRGLLQRGIFVYIDDIIVTSKTWKEHLLKIEEVLLRLKKYGLVAKMEKCRFVDKSANILGFEVNKAGVRPEAWKVAAIADLPTPQTVKQLMSFLNMIGYFRRFIKNYSKKAAPLRRIMAAASEGYDSKTKWKRPLV